MKCYVVNNLKSNEYDILVTILDYKARTSYIIKDLVVLQGRKVLFDNILVGGNNEYRFIGYDGNGEVHYVEPSKEIQNYANEILRLYPERVENSVLPEIHINKLLKGEKNEILYQRK